MGLGPPRPPRLAAPAPARPLTGASCVRVWRACQRLGWGLGVRSSGGGSKRDGIMHQPSVLTAASLVCMHRPASPTSRSPALARKQNPKRHPPRQARRSFVWYEPRRFDRFDSLQFLHAGVHISHINQYQCGSRRPARSVVEARSCVVGSTREEKNHTREKAPMGASSIAQQDEARLLGASSSC